MFEMNFVLQQLQTLQFDIEQMGRTANSIESCLLKLFNSEFYFFR